jgi:DNA repair protein RecO (recombination protein O)
MEQTEAILIRRQSWSETSLIVTWFTLLHGKVGTMAKAARRANSPFSGVLDLFHRAEIGYLPGRKSPLGILREARLLAPFESKAVANVFLGGYFAELLDLATQPSHPHPEMFDLLSRAVAHLNSKPASRRALEFFERELVRLLGIDDSASHPLEAIETYCGRIPPSRQSALRMLPP